MLIFSAGIGSFATGSLFGRTVSTPNTVAMNEKVVSTRIGRLARPSAMSPIEIEKTTKLAPIRIDALVSAMPLRVMLVALAATSRLWTSFGKTGSFGLTSFGSLIAKNPLPGGTLASLDRGRKQVSFFNRGDQPASRALQASERARRRDTVLAFVLAALAASTSSPALEISVPWWERVTVTVDDKGKQQSCQYEVSLMPAGAKPCDEELAASLPSSRGPTGRF